MTPPDPSPAAPVDTSAEAVARWVAGLKEMGLVMPVKAAAILAAVVKERDEATALHAEAFRIGIHHQERADTASRQLAEATHFILCNLPKCMTGIDGCSASYEQPCCKARALLSGETTI